VHRRAAALTQTSGAELLDGVLSARLVQQRQRLARLLRGAALAPFEDALAQRLAAAGRPLGARRAEAPTREARAPT
jgi:hypothetical protein